MRAAIRPLFVAILVLASTVALGVSAALTAAVGLVVAVTPLIVPGTGTKNPANSENYMEHAVSYYVNTSGSCGEGCAAAVPVPYIAEFWPFPFEGWGGLEGAKWNVSVGSGVTSLTSQLVGANNPNADHPVVVFGYSQGATVSSIVKGQLADLTPEEKANLGFVLIGNPNRPDGGLFERLAILGTVPILDATFGQPTSTTAGIDTYDIALQYDGVADAPSWVLNPLALLNALAGFEYTHPSYLAPDGDDQPSDIPYGYTPDQVQAAIEQAHANCTAATHCQKQGDTTYVTLPAKTLPIMQPFLDLADATGTSAIVVPIVDLISPLAQTLIETGYTRTNYGTPTPFQLLPKIDPVKLVKDLINDIPEGIKAALHPGLDPLPGWTDPTVPSGTSRPTTIDPTPGSETRLLADNGTVTKVAPKTPLRRLARVTKLDDGPAKTDAAKTDVDKTDAPQPSSRKAWHTTRHPIRDLTKSLRDSVRKTFDQSKKPTADKEHTRPPTKRVHPKHVSKPRHKNSTRHAA